MPASTIGRVRDPLTETFAVEELPAIAPWIYDEIRTIGPDRIKAVLAEQGQDADRPQSMQTWVSAISACHSDLWRALAQG